MRRECVSASVADTATATAAQLDVGPVVPVDERANDPGRSTRGALLLGGRQLLTIVLSASSAVLLARWLQPADYGRFATLHLMVFGAATLLGDLGLTVSLVRQIDEPPASQWAAARRLVAALASAAFLGGAIGSTVLWQGGHDELALWVGVLAAALAARFARSVPSARLQRQRRFVVLAAIETVESLCYFAVVLVLAARGHGAGSLALAVGVKEVLGYGAQRWAVRGGPRLRGVRGSYRELLSVGLPVQASGLLVALTDAFQPLFIGVVLGLTSLGYVSWAYNLVLMPILLLGAIDRVVLPSLARVQDDRILLGLLTARAIRLNALIAFPVVIAVLVAPSELVSLVFSHQWLPAADLLVLFTPAIVTTAMTAPLFHAFNAIGQTRVAMWLSASWLIVTWTAGAAATATWGAVGFGWFYVVLQVAYVPVWRLAKRSLGVDVIAETRDALAGLVLGALGGSLIGTALSPTSRWAAVALAIVVGELVFVATMATFERARTRADVYFLAAGLGLRRQPVTRVKPAATAKTGSGDVERWRLGYVRALDGLRGCAVLLVMAHHANVPLMQGGFLGVDVFFVLSGFLITALLCQEFDRAGRVSLRRFYARRLLRLTPALLVMVAVVVPVLLVWQPGQLRSDSLAAAPWTLGYATNYLAMVVDRGLGVFGHTWSLAIEEQFYVLWPPVLVWLLVRRSARFIASALMCAAAVVAVGRAVVWLRFENAEYTYFALHARADALLIGCVAALALTAASTAVVRSTASRLAPLAAACGLALAVLMTFARTTSGWVHVAGFLMAAVASVGVISHLAAAPESFVARLLSWRPIAAVGTLSYGLYLWHVPVFELVKDAYPLMPFRYLLVLQVGGSAVVAVASYAVVECPMLRLKERFAADAAR